MTKVTIDFGCDFVREYSLTRELDQKLRQGEMLKIETMHPRHAEHMIATSVSQPSSSKTITIPLELAERIYLFIRMSDLEGRDIDSKPLGNIITTQAPIPGIELAGKYLDDFFIASALNGGSNG